MLMNLKVAGLAMVGAAMLAAAPVTATAQEIAPSHIEAAHRAASSAPSVGDFDRLLPYMADQTQNRLIRLRPDLFREIATAVEGQALQLAPRRENLDNQIARIWARRFSEEELNQITAFFQSEVGRKYIEVAPGVGQAMVKTSQAWAKRVSDEMYERSVEALDAAGHEF